MGLQNFFQNSINDFYAQHLIRVWAEDYFVLIDVTLAWQNMCILYLYIYVCNL